MADEYKSALNHFKSACDLQLSVRKEMRKARKKPDEYQRSALSF